MQASGIVCMFRVGFKAVEMPEPAGVWWESASEHRCVDDECDYGPETFRLSHKCVGLN